MKKTVFLILVIFSLLALMLSLSACGGDEGAEAAPPSVDLSGVTLESSAFEYDGEPHSLTVSGELPEGVSVEYEGNGQSGAGEFLIKAKFYLGGQHVEGADITATLSITVTPGLILEENKAGNVAVVGYEGDVGRVVIPHSYNGKDVVSVKESAFRGNKAVTEVSVPDSVTYIGEDAFLDCTSLTHVTLGDGIVSIRAGAFENTALRELTVPQGVSSLGFGCLRGTAIESLTLPFVGERADGYNSHLGYIFGAEDPDENADLVPYTLKSVILSEECRTLSEDAFVYCTGIESIYLPVGLTVLPGDSPVGSAFFGCQSGLLIAMGADCTPQGFAPFSLFVGVDNPANLARGVTKADYFEMREDKVSEIRSSLELKGLYINHQLWENFDPIREDMEVDVDVNLGYPTVTVSSVSGAVSVQITQPDYANGGACTVTVVGEGGSKTYNLSFNLTGVLVLKTEIVNKNGASGVVTFVLDDGGYATANFSEEMLEKYENLFFTYALKTNQLATLETSRNSETGKREYRLDEDGHYVYTANDYAVDFWREKLELGRTEVVSHTHTHSFWGINDDGGDFTYVNNSGQVVSAYDLPAGSATAELYASKQIIEELLGVDALTLIEPGIGVPTTDKWAGGVLYPTYYTYYRQILLEAIRNDVYASVRAGTFYASSASDYSSFVNRPENLATPGGRMNVMFMAVMKDDDPSKWTKYIDDAMEDGGWAAYCIHEIEDNPTGTLNISKEKAEELFAYAEGKNVWMAGYTEASLYYAEWATSSVSAVCDGEAIHLTLTDDENNEVYNQALTVKLTLPRGWESATLDGESLTVHTDTDGTSFVYVNAVPDSGTVTLTKG